MPTITLKKLHTEGRLTLGDTLHHSETGDHELVGIVDAQTVRVKDAQGNYHRWQIDFGPDARIVEVAL